ncbi:hypothetical protein [Mycoplasma leonicaptivi]|uniref:hypothetical protein n=1 Tax=Mycoplasma leonicaptivi TaxID=36742 RepID=UPI000482284C|nr:hypothetical protein [Mycoplasma leonicaptivi]
MKRKKIWIIIGIFSWLGIASNIAAIIVKNTVFKKQEIKNELNIAKIEIQKNSDKDFKVIFQFNNSDILNTLNNNLTFIYYEKPQNTNAENYWNIVKINNYSYNKDINEISIDLNNLAKEKEYQFIKLIINNKETNFESFNEATIKI